jgi:predicted amidohydrolase
VSGGEAHAGYAARDLRLTLVQADTIWHDAEANRARIAAQLAERRAPTDLIILPETFTTGFSNAALATAETMDGPTLAWMRAQARAHNAAITGSVQVRDGAGVFNRLLWVTPDGAAHHYDKRHLFRMAGEHEHYAAGHDRLVVAWRGWRVCPLVCYDLRFPVFSRNRADASGSLEYDLLLYVANWPAPRHEAWRTLLRARAIENLAAVAAVNRCGTDGNGHPYAGGSAVIDAVGRTVIECADEAGVVDVVLSRAGLLEHRRRFPAHLDADGFTLAE